MQHGTAPTGPQATRRASRYLGMGVVLAAAGSKDSSPAHLQVSNHGSVIRNHSQPLENKGSA
jgi:hypothetical protein